MQTETSTMLHVLWRRDNDKYACQFNGYLQNAEVLFRYTMHCQNEKSSKPVAENLRVQYFEVEEILDKPPLTKLTKKSRVEMEKTLITIGLLCIVFTGYYSSSKEMDSTALQTPYVEAEDPIQAGRYLVIVGGCNDCHTDGYLMLEGNVPEENWLTGSPMGWQGPWGTTYPSNLRLRVQEWSEDIWVQTLKTRKVKPPMPWMNVNQLSEQDARAIYAYIQSLGPKGEHMPAAVVPGVEPTTPYLSLFPQNLPETEEN